MESFPTPDSTQFSSVQYFPESGKLRIFFLNATAYDYAGVPALVYDGFLNAADKDLYYSTYVITKDNPTQFPASRFL